MSGPPPLRPRPGLGCTVGIDPGAHGAIGVLDGRAHYLAVWDMPVIGEGRASEFDTDQIVALALGIGEEYRRPQVRLEWPQTRPDEAPESSKRFGVGLGILWAAFVAAGCEVVREAPNGWKGRLGLRGKAGDPHAARLEAVTYAERVIAGLPDAALRGPRGGLLDGRAEALLIAWESASRSSEALRAMPPDLREARLLLGGRRGRGRGRNTGI